MPELDRDWVWDGGRPSLDFVNTLRDRYTADGRELLREPGDLVAWCRAAGLLDGTRGRSGPAELAAARELREAVDAVAVREADRRTPRVAVDLVNGWAARAPAPALRLVRGQVEVASGRPVATVAGALALVALDAVELVADEPGATRVCAARRCGLRFVDRSPAGNRQWCSMRRCGNREKARLHYARERSAGRRSGESAE